MFRSKIRAVIVTFVAALSVAIVSGSVVPSDSQARAKKPGAAEVEKARACKGVNFPGGQLGHNTDFQLNLANGYTVSYTCIDGTYCYTINYPDGELADVGCRFSPAEKKASKKLRPNHSGPAKASRATG